MNSCLFKNNRYPHIIDFLNYSKSVTPSLVVILFTGIPQATLSSIKLTIAPKIWWQRETILFWGGQAHFFRGKVLGPRFTTDVHCISTRTTTKKTPGKQPLRRQSSINLGETPKKQPSPSLPSKQWSWGGHLITMVFPTSQ